MDVVWIVLLCQRDGFAADDQSQQQRSEGASSQLTTQPSATQAKQRVYSSSVHEPAKEDPAQACAGALSLARGAARAA